MMWLARLALWLDKGWVRKPRKGCLPALYLILLAASTVTWAVVGTAT